MKPILITRGATWHGLELLPGDLALDPVDIAGCTPRMVMRRAATREVIYDFDPVIATIPEDGETAAYDVIQVPEIADEVTLTLPAGRFVTDLLIEDENGRVWGPYIPMEVIVETAISRGAA